jgi:L-alanine-DL-glutamate epimerase-like enolase superfamily enzyme
MKITKIETIRLGTGVSVHAGAINWLWVRIHTDAGLIGLGETYPTAEAAESVVLHSLAPLLLGRDARQIERLWADMFLKISYHGWAGAELRAISAVDIALWDLLGKLTGQPVYQLLGGKCRDRIPTYNTCYDHVFDFHCNADLLAEDLLDQGIEVMKIWPFDEVALANRGQSITSYQMARCLEPIRKIREAVGSRMQIAMEFHGYWNLPSAVKIARALEPYHIVWLEEMLPQDNLAAYKHLAGETSIPLVLSERLMTRWQFREVIEGGFVQFINPDVCWCGGISEARKIAAHAETYYLPIAPHNCGGPILHIASLHLAAAMPNLYMLESVRRHYLKEYQDVVTNAAPASDGWLPIPEGPGLGVELAPALFERPDLTIREVVA